MKNTLAFVFSLIVSVSVFSSCQPQQQSAAPIPGAVGLIDEEKQEGTLPLQNGTTHKFPVAKKVPLGTPSASPTPAPGNYTFIGRLTATDASAATATYILEGAGYKSGTLRSGASSGSANRGSTITLTALVRGQKNYIVGDIVKDDGTMVRELIELDMPAQPAPAPTPDPTPTPNPAITTAFTSTSMNSSNVMYKVTFNREVKFRYQVWVNGTSFANDTTTDSVFNLRLLKSELGYTITKVRTRLEEVGGGQFYDRTDDF